MRFHHWMRGLTVGCLPTYLLAGVLVVGSVSLMGAQAGSATAPRQSIPGERAAFSVVRIKLSPDSESEDWGIGIRGRNFWAVHVTTSELMEWAYGVNARQIEQAPKWLPTERFDVDGLPDAGAEPTRDQYRIMLRSVLADRFQMRFHASERMLPVYVLSLASGGLKIAKAADAGAKASWGVHRGWLSIQSMTFANVAQVLQRTVFDRPVLDRTGLSDRYSFILRWRADETQFTQMQGVDVPEETGTADAADIDTASREQLGVKIEAKKALAPILILDGVAHPSEN